MTVASRCCAGVDIGNGSTHECDEIQSHADGTTTATSWATNMNQKPLCGRPVKHSALQVVRVDGPRIYDRRRFLQLGFVPLHFFPCRRQVTEPFFGSMGGVVFASLRAVQVAVIHIVIRLGGLAVVIWSLTELALSCWFASCEGVRKSCIIGICRPVEKRNVIKWSTRLFDAASVLGPA